MIQVENLVGEHALTMCITAGARREDVESDVY
jgi:hypothetical protein